MVDIVGYFPATLAIDSATGTRLKNAEAQVYALTDTSFSNPLPITDMSDVPFTSDTLVSNSDGIYPEFKPPAGVVQVIVKSGQALTPMTSISAQVETTVQAATDAEAAATRAQEAASRAAAVGEIADEQVAAALTRPGGSSPEIVGTLAANAAAAFIDPDPTYAPEDDTGLASLLGWDPVARKTFVADLSPLDTPDAIRAVSTEDQSAASTSMVFDNELGAGFDNPGVYRGTIFLPYSAGTSGDFKFGFSVPADASLLWSYRGIRVDGAAATDQNSSYTMVGVQLDKTGIGRVGGTGSSFINFVTIEFLLTIVTPGTFRLQFGQNSSDTTPSVRRSGARMQIEDWGSATMPRNGMQFILNDNIWRPNSPEKSYSLLIQRNVGTPADMATFKSAYTRHELRAGDQWFGDASKGKGVERCEMASATYWSFGVDIWVSYSFRYTGPFVQKNAAGEGYMLIGQFIQSPPEPGESKVPHCLSEYLTEGYYTLDTRGDDAAITTEKFEGTERVHIPFTAGVWHHVVKRIRLGYANNGELDVWFDGTQVANVRSAKIGYNDPRGPRTKFGMYRSRQTFTTTLELANYEIGYADLSARVTSPLPRVLPSGVTP